MPGKLLARPRSGGDCYRARPASFAARDVVPRVSHHVHLRRWKLEAGMRHAPAQRTRTERIAVMVIVSKSAEREKMPEVVILQFQFRAAPQISREQAEGRSGLARQIFKQIANARQNTAVASR